MIEGRSRIYIHAFMSIMKQRLRAFPWLRVDVDLLDICTVIEQIKNLYIETVLFFYVLD